MQLNFYRYLQRLTMLFFGGGARPLLALLVPPVNMDKTLTPNGKFHSMVNI
jgi:hypothetical protein